ncbi:hypothetical protein CSC06_0168 [Escherichia coli]|nr:hypothetical protein CSC06_0168 [Escherichia coli]KDX66366.1 hypothetical protein AB02_3286 [Escherichia coli 2-222-05_S1_C1]KDX73237.1 hypothetical protein AB31_4042 [Escherichia coli 2-222-05_S1_C2]KDX77909.1 hypothetical protein AB63_4020 [Escherichia coli 2-222-05_S1_C3]DAK68907.1 MAG TPA: hypothetical protein [Caudoviricetes sp.]
MLFLIIENVWELKSLYMKFITVALRLNHENLYKNECL